MTTPTFSASRCAGELRRAGAHLTTALSAGLRPLGLTVAGLEVLQLLDIHDGLSPCQLGALRHVSPGTMTGLLEGLERTGAVDKMGHPGDARMVVVRITPAGRALLRRGTVVERRVCRALLEPLGDDAATLARLAVRLGPWDGPTG